MSSLGDVENTNFDICEKWNWYLSSISTKALIEMLEDILKKSFYCKITLFQLPFECYIRHEKLSSATCILHGKKN